MPERRFFSVGYQFPGDEIEYLPLNSERSLLDADMILFTPGIHYGHRGHEVYQGKPLLSNSGSFRATQEAAHWRSELKAAVEEGKTVIVFLKRPEEAFVDTGEKLHSGTGRNRSTTNIVKPFSSYDALPLRFDRVYPKGGEVIVPAKDLGYLTSYWKDFADVSPYEVYVDGTFSKVFLTTKTGGKSVGAALHGKGTLLLIPPIAYDEDEFIETDDKGQQVWTKEAIVFGKRLVKALVELEKASRSGKEVTPTPTWATDPQYRLKAESDAEKQINEVTAKIEALQAEKSLMTTRLETEGTLRRLLFETGHALEGAILEALRLMGFSAETYADAESEFDAVFTSPEGRFLGEAEGKDNKPVNIDKLSQLERNVQEDFARDDVSDYAKGVLFGNAYRLTDVAERGDFFTIKCMSGAQRSKVALVRTPDLFPVARYLKENSDPDFAQRCREALAVTEGGIVRFPVAPSLEGIGATVTRAEEASTPAADAQKN